MKHTKQLAYLRQLCCLGLPKEAVMAEFLTAVKTVIPSGNNVFTLVDQHGFPANAIMETLIPELAELSAEVIPRFFTENRENVMRWESSEIMTNPRCIVDDFYCSDLYNLLWRPLAQYHTMMAQIVAQDRVAGWCNLFRDKLAKPFSEVEKNLLNHLKPYLAHAFSVEDNNIKAEGYVASGQSAMLLTDVNGIVQYCSSLAEKLLFLAGYNQQENGFQLNQSRLPQALSQLCQNLRAIFSHDCAPPPEITHVNGMGRFVFRAYWLTPLDTGSNGLVSILIEHQEPLILKLLRALQDFPLSPTQKEVALLLAKGESSEAICQALHIKRSTLKDHLDKIFSKLDIHRREELLPILLARGKARVLH